MIMLPANIIRSLKYIEEKSNLLLLDAKGGSGASALHEHIVINEFWKFYIELIPYLEKYAVEVNAAQVSDHTRLFIRHLKDMNNYQKSRSWFWGMFSSGQYHHYREKDEYIEILQNIRNNVSNFIYQVKINSEEVK